MEISYPIPANPEFSILESPGYREYRVEKIRRQSQRRQGIVVPFFLFCCLAVALYWQSVNFFLLVLDPTTAADYCPWKKAFFKFGIYIYCSLDCCILYCAWRFRPGFVRWGLFLFCEREVTGLTDRLESVIILGPHGIQLETHRGFLTRLPWLTNRRFIASTHLHSVYINEGLRGWNVRFYLVAIKRTALSGSTLEVAYQVSDLKKLFAYLGYSTTQNLLPDQSILQHVYQGIHEILLSSPTATNRGD